MKPLITLEDYQKEAARTINYDLTAEQKLTTFGLGIAGEAGEIADILKKHLGHGHELDLEAMGKEIGDLLWYTVNLANLLKLPLNRILENNVTKLRIRYPDGFTNERSRNRTD